MKTEYERAYHALEDDHWWFRGRRDMILRLLSALPKDSRILEIGCSGGPLLARLRELGFHDVWGIDISEEAVRACKARGLPNVSVADGAATGFPEGYFDVVIASDVLEHIDDEAKAMADWRRILKPGGKLIVFVPAHMFLWSSHDDANQHKKRYAKNSFLRLINGNFTVEQWSYWNMSLFFPIAIVRFLMHMLPKGVGEGRQLRGMPRFLNSLFSQLLFAENYLIAKGVWLPAGVSLFCLAEKPR